MTGIDPEQTINHMRKRAGMMVALCTSVTYQLHLDYLRQRSKVLAVQIAEAEAELLAHTHV